MLPPQKRLCMYIPSKILLISHFWSLFLGFDPPVTSPYITPKYLCGLTWFNPHFLRPLSSISKSNSKLPFIKRKAYEGESEIRFITKLDSNNYFIRFTDEEMHRIVEKVIIGPCIENEEKERMKKELKDKGIKCNISRVLNYSKWVSFIVNNLEKW